MQQNSWLYSDSFLKRAFAIWGHNMVASLIIIVPVWILMFGLMAFMIRSAFQSIPWDQLHQQQTQQGGVRMELQP